MQTAVIVAAVLLAVAAPRYRVRTDFQENSRLTMTLFWQPGRLWRGRVFRRAAERLGVPALQRYVLRRHPVSRKSIDRSMIFGGIEPSMRLKPWLISDRSAASDDAIEQPAI